MFRYSRHGSPSRSQRARTVAIFILYSFSLTVLGLSASFVSLTKGDSNVDYDFDSRARDRAIVALSVSSVSAFVLLPLCGIQAKGKYLNSVVINEFALNILWGLWLAVCAYAASLDREVPSCSSFAGKTFTLCALFRAYQAFAWPCVVLAFALALVSPVLRREFWPKQYREEFVYAGEAGPEEIIVARKVPARRATPRVVTEPSPAAIEKPTTVNRLRKSRVMGGKAKAKLFRKSPPSYEGAPSAVKVEKEVVKDDGTVLSEDNGHVAAAPAVQQVGPKIEQTPVESPKLRLAHDIPSGDLDLTDVSKNEVLPEKRVGHQVTEGPETVEGANASASKAA